MKYTLSYRSTGLFHHGLVAQGEVILTIEEVFRGSKTILTDWIDTGLGAGRHTIQTGLLDTILVDELPLGEEYVIYGRPGYFKKLEQVPAMPEVRQSILLNSQNGRIRLALRLKDLSSKGTIRVLWTAIKAEILAEVADELEEEEQPEETAAPVEEPVETFEPAEESVEETEAAAEEAAEVASEETIEETEEPAEEAEADEVDEEVMDEETFAAPQFYIENPPVELHPGWKYTFRVHVPEHLQGQKVVWSVSREGAEGEEYTGSIDKWGQLTAPTVPGMVEVAAHMEGIEFPATCYVMITA